MALIDPQYRRKLSIPNEPDEWVELRPITARDITALQRDREGMDTPSERTRRLLLLCMTAWSYEAPITLETLETLDVDTFNWLDEKLMLTAAVRSEEEKKAYDLESSPISAPDTDDSPLNLPTSPKRTGAKSTV